MTAPKVALQVATACLLGLVVCPYGFIAVGALSSYPALFSVVMLPPFLLGSGFLLWRYLSRPSPAPGRRRFLLVFEGLSWLAVGVFLFFISNFTLLTDLERFGAVCTDFLAASALFLAVVLLRSTALEQRLGRLPRAVVLIFLILLLVAAVPASVRYLVTPPKFL